MSLRPSLLGEWEFLVKQDDARPISINFRFSFFNG
jgi:hypothetical protein